MNKVIRIGCCVLLLLSGCAGAPSNKSKVDRCVESGIPYFRCVDLVHDEED